MPKPEISAVELGELIVAAIRSAKKPVTFKGLVSQVKSKEEPVRAALEIAVQAGQLFRWPNKGKSQYFWHVSAEKKAREQVLAAASARAMSKADLIQEAGYPVKQLPRTIPDLLAEKQLQTVPAFASSAKLLVRTGEQEAYFRTARAFLEKKILAAGFDPSAFFAETSTPETATPLPSTPVDSAKLVLETVERLEPVRGVPVSTLRLRNELQLLSKQEFDLAALELRKKHAVFLSQHADPYNLSEQDRNLLIDGQDGTYYVAISLR
jgi:hypothetical protein